MPSPYRAVLSIPGAVSFSAAGVLARMPMSMVGLGIVLLVSSRTGSYSTAGTVSAAFIAANAIVAVPLARLVDRRGQRAVLGIAASASALGLAALMVAVEAGWPAPVPHLLAALAGAVQPNVGAAVRARWSHVVTDRPQLDTAFAVEAVNDELVFVVGPTLVTLLASAVHPLAGLTTATVAMVAGTWWFVAQRRTEPPAARPARGAAPDSPLGRGRAPVPWARLVPVIVGGVMLGALFGGCEVAVVAFADERGVKPVSGVLLAVWALGSLLAGLVCGHLVWRRTAATRYQVGITVLALLMLPLPFVPTVPVLAAVLFLAGAAISPTMIAAVSLVQQVVPASRLNEGMTVFSTGLNAGVAPGAALTGVVIDAAGASPAFWVAAGAGLLAAVVAVAASRSGTAVPSVPDGETAGPAARSLPVESR